MNPTKTSLCNDTLFAPPGTPKGECADLPIFRTLHGVYSFWKPESEEIQRLTEGQPIFVFFDAPTHPPMAIGVMQPGKEEPPGDSGAARISRERLRQIVAEKFTEIHDDMNVEGELAKAAAVYALASICVSGETDLESVKEQIMETGCEPMWPWDEAWLKLSNDPVRMLEKAGALIAAEIDRLRRKAGKEGA